VAGGRVLLVGGHNGFGPLRTLEEFTPGEEVDSPGTWRELPPMQSRRCYLSAAVADGRLYALGGTSDGRVLNSFEVFDLEREQWAPWFRNQPSVARRTTLACALHGEGSGQGPVLYVAGGFDSVKDLQSVEGLNLLTHNWERKEAMLQARSYHAMVATSDGIFAIGGQDRNSADKDVDVDESVHGAVSALNDVEFFRFDTENWEHYTPMDIPRQGLAAVCLVTEEGDELVYVCGGCDGESALDAVDILDPKTGKWSPGPPMNVPRSSHALVAVGGRLYAIGGADRGGTLDTFECLDPAEGRWSKPIKMGGAPVEAIADA
jgi:hypothetical protein